MPFVSNMPDDENTQNAPAQGAVPATGGAPVQLTPSNGVVGAGASTNPASNPQAGGSFATLDKYLTANQGQADPLAGKVTAGINQQYNTLARQNASTINDINNQVSASALPSNTNAIIAQEAANPVSFASNPSNISSFQNILNASYAGPASAEGTAGYTNQQNAINSAISQGQQQTQTEAGREQLLSQSEAAPSASVTGLNSAILSSSPTALGTVEHAYDPFSNLLTGLSSSAADIDKQIAQNQQNIATTSANAQNQLNTQIGGLNTAVTGELTAAQKAAADQNAAVTAALKGIYGGVGPDTTATSLGTYGGGSTPWYNTTNYSVGSISPDIAAALGMTPDQASALQSALSQAATSQYMTGHNFGAGSPTAQVDLTQFLTQTDPSTLSAANVATPEQYAQAQAFQSLLNGMNLQTPQLILNPTQAALAGTAPKNLNTFDYQTALNTANQLAAQERAAAQAEATGLTSAADLAHAQSQHGGGMFGGTFGNVLGTLGKYLVNPMTTVPQQIGIAKNLAGKVA